MANTTGAGASAISGHGRQAAQWERNTQKQIEQIQRQRVTFPDQSSGGGFVGIVNIGSVNDSVIVRSGGLSIAWESVRYRTPELVAGRSGWLRFDGSDIYVAPGLYHPVLLTYLVWDSGEAPAAAAGYMHGGQDWAHQNNEADAPVNNRVARPFNFGPTYMTATDYLRAEVDFTGAAGPLLAGATLNWTITKLA